VTLVQISRARNGKPKDAKTVPAKTLSQVIYLTHSTCASARAQLYQPTGTTLYKFNFPTFECGKVCPCHSELPALDPQPQPVLEMHHSSQNGWGQAVHVRQLHPAGDQEQQHRCVHGEDLATEEGTTLSRRMGALFRKREAPAPISSPATAVIYSLLYTML